MEKTTNDLSLSHDNGATGMAVTDSSVRGSIGVTEAMLAKRVMLEWRGCPCGVCLKVGVEGIYEGAEHDEHWKVVRARSVQRF